MLLITTTPISFTGRKVIRLLHNFDNKNPLIELEAQRIKGSKTIVRLGQTYMDDSNVYGNDSIILHSCSEQLLKDYLRRLLPWKDRLRKFMKDPKRYLVVYGNAMSLLSDLVCIIPQQDNVIANSMQTSSAIDVTTRGLGLTKYWCTTVSNIDRLGTNFKRSLSYISRTRPIYLLTSSTVINEKGSVAYGDLYLVKDGNFEKVRELIEPETEKAQEVQNEREVDMQPTTPEEQQAVVAEVPQPGTTEVKH